jgi:hypothetical protein
MVIIVNNACYPLHPSPFTFMKSCICDGSHVLYTPGYTKLRR